MDQNLNNGEQSKPVETPSVQSDAPLTSTTTHAGSLFPRPQPWPPKQYKSTDAVSALLMLLMGFGFIHLILFGGLGLGSSLYALLLCGFVLVYSRRKKARLPLAVFWPLPVFGLSFFLSSNPLIKALALLFLIGWFPYVMFCCGDNRQERDASGCGMIGNLLPADLISSFFVRPFTHFVDVFRALFVLKKNGWGRKVGPAAVGLLLAFPVVLILAAILRSGDAAFSGLLDHLAQVIPQDLPTYFGEFLLGIPVAMYLFGALYGSFSAHKSAISRKAVTNAVKGVKFVPPLTVYVLVGAVILLYLLFFLSQTAYFISAFQSIVPADFTPAEYARRDFSSSARYRF